MDVQVAIDKLASLGSPDEIADHLRYLGITASRQHHNRCAIAQYVAQECGIPAHELYVGPISGVYVYQGPSVEIYDTPVAEFICNFDNGEYPFLEAV